jgi:predicted nucleic acid-binding protein
MTMMGGKLFVDTNVLIYASIAESPFHQAARQALADAYQTYDNLWISPQVIREFLVVLTRPQSAFGEVSREAVMNQIAYFYLHFAIAEDSVLVNQHLLRLIEDFQVSGKQVHDTNIVATMQAYGINTLLTHNTKDFKRFTSLIQLHELV